MLIVKLIVFILLFLLPAVQVVRDWKYHDKRTRSFHRATKIILIVYVLLVIPSAYFLWTDTQEGHRLQAALLEAVTGGNSYPEISIGFDSGNPGHLPLYATTVKTDTATSFDYVIAQVADDDSCLLRRGGTFISRGTTGPMRPRMPIIIPDRLTPSKTEASIYCILMVAKNGGFTEILRLTPNADKLRFAWTYTILDGGNVVVANGKFPY